MLVINKNGSDEIANDVRIRNQMSLIEILNFQRSVALRNGMLH